MTETAEKSVKTDRPLYIANQVTYEGLDELQRLMLAYLLSLPVALDGPPGVGKTQSVIELSGILGRPLFTRTCSGRTSESQIIAYPVLTSREGVSVTEYMDGPLCRAMISPGIFYGDEFNLLKEDVQKRLNSAFDERRSIDRPDGAQIKAKPGFFALISYNPSDSLVTRDLEPSVADRFIHFHYRRWAPDFKAYVAYCRARGTSRNQLAAKNPFGLTLRWRGFTSKYGFLKGKLNGSHLQWVDFFTDEPTAEKPVYSYLTFDDGSILTREETGMKEGLNSLARQALNELDLSRMLARFTDLLSSLTRGEDTPLLKKVGLSDLKKREDLELLSLHESSARVEMAAMKHYRELVKRGCHPYLAQSYAVRLIIDQVCYGQYRDRKLRDTTAYELVHLVARNLGLLADSTRYNTKFVTEEFLAL